MGERKGGGLRRGGARLVDGAVDDVREDLVDHLVNIEERLERVRDDVRDCGGARGQRGWGWEAARPAAGAPRSLTGREYCLDRREELPPDGLEEDGREDPLELLAGADLRGERRRGGGAWGDATRRAPAPPAPPHLGVVDERARDLGDEGLCSGAREGGGKGLRQGRCCVAAQLPLPLTLGLRALALAARLERVDGVARELADALLELPLDLRRRGGGGALLGRPRPSPRVFYFRCAPPRARRPRAGARPRRGGSRGGGPSSRRRWGCTARGRGPAMGGKGGERLGGLSASPPSSNDAPWRRPGGGCPSTRTSRS